MAGSHQWRRVIATLADSGRRTLYGRILAGEAEGRPVAVASFDQADRRRLRALVEAGLVEQGELARSRDAFTPLLAEDAPSRPEGPERFVPGGRLIGLPRRQADRDELFAWLGERLLAPGEVLDEKTFTERLTAFTDDAVSWRRYLVDARVVRRNPQGHSYQRDA